MAQEMSGRRDLILQTAPNLTFFQETPVTVEEASWALASASKVHSELVLRP